MHITCPDCNTRYQVDPASFPDDGRSVRCARCRTVWHAVPSGEILVPQRIATQPAEESPIQREPDGRAAMVDDGGLPERPEDGGREVEAEAGVRARMAAQAAVARGASPASGRKGAGNRLQSVALGALLALAVAGVHYRADVVRAVPESARLFETVGLPVNLRGLDFDNVSQRRVFEDGLPVLIVEGEVVNLREDTTGVPALRFALRGSAGQEIYAWTVEPRRSEIRAGERMSFRTRLSAPPEGAEEVQVRFAGRTRQTAGLEP